MITILLEKIKALLIELKNNIENMGGDIDYSLNEIKMGKWIDGNDYYKITKVFEPIALHSSAPTSYFSIDLVNPDEIIDYTVMMVRTDKRFIKFNYSSGYNYSSGFVYHGNTLEFTGNDTWQAEDYEKIVLTILYTKTEEANND